MTRIIPAVALTSFSIACYAAETIRATGYVRVKIVAVKPVELPTVNNLMEDKDVPYVVVYTQNGATMQVVF